MSSSTRCKKPQILLVNGSLRGTQGNSHRLMGLATSHSKRLGANAVRVTLATFRGTIDELRKSILSANAFVFITGCYWASPGSLIQRFIEVATRWELGPEFLGKPAIVISSMHSVGGLEAARSIAGTLQLLGCLLPPLGTMSLSYVGQTALTHGENEDIWSLSDLGVVIENLLLATSMRQQAWAAWPVARAQPAESRFLHRGPTDLDESPWLSSGEE